MSKKPISERIKNIKATLEALAAAHPVIAESKPLALLIHLQIRDAHPELSNTQINRALRSHCLSLDYLNAVAKGGARFNLDGTENGTVTAEQAQIAKAGATKIMTIRRKIKQVKKAEPNKTEPATAPPVPAKPEVKVMVKRRRKIPAGSATLSLRQAG